MIRLRRKPVYSPREGELDRRRSGLLAAHATLPRRKPARPSLKPEVLRIGLLISTAWRQRACGSRFLGTRPTSNPPRDRTDFLNFERPGRGTRKTFERELYVIRRPIEKAALAAQRSDPLTSRRCPAGPIIYKAHDAGAGIGPTFLSDLNGRTL